MARNDMQAILGALLGGAAAGGLRPKRRRRAPAPLLDVRVGGSRTAARALATLAGAVLGSMLGGGTQPPPPPKRARPPVDVRPTAPPSPPPPSPPPPSPPPSPLQRGSSPRPMPNPWSSPAPPAKPAAPEPLAADAEDAEALLILRAMISCAKADGTLDAAERRAIAGQLDQAGLDHASRDLVLAEFARPASVADIAAAVADPVLAAQVYAAAFLAAGEVGPAERGWLDAFLHGAGLDPHAAAAIEARLAPP